MDIILILFLCLYMLPLIVSLLLFPVIHYLAKKEGSNEEVSQDLIWVLSLAPGHNILTMIELLVGVFYGIVNRKRYFKDDNNV